MKPENKGYFFVFYSAPTGSSTINSVMTHSWRLSTYDLCGMLMLWCCRPESSSLSSKLSSRGKCSHVTLMGIRFFLLGKRKKNVDTPQHDVFIDKWSTLNPSEKRKAMHWYYFLLSSCITALFFLYILTFSGVCFVFVSCPRRRHTLFPRPRRGNGSY